jgi:hypothetical protein
VLEIALAESALVVLAGATRELSQKSERLSTFQYEVNRLSTAKIMEQHKCICLIHEFSIPRNVHRWAAIGAVDPGYVTQLHFRAGLSTKLDAAHRELIQLVAERDALRKQLDLVKEERESPKNTKESVASAEQQYEDDIARIDREIQSMNAERRSLQPLISTAKTRVDGVRSGLSNRRLQPSLLKYAMADMRKPEADSQPVYYITESPLFNPTHGGGFQLRQTTNARASIPTPLNIVSTPVSRAKSQKAATSLSQLAKGMKSPYVGRNILLPSLD